MSEFDRIVNEPSSQSASQSASSGTESDTAQPSIAVAVDNAADDKDLCEAVDSQIVYI